MKPALLVLAAGMGSRYGGIKQMDSFGPSGETIIDYSIYDAIESGFGKIVFIVRSSFHDEFKEKFDSKIKERVETVYVNQEQDMFLGSFSMPPERTKPWGTAHAVLCAKDVIHEPFAVINADDFYGKDAFVQCAEFLNKGVSPQKYCIIGYKLGNTISPNGTVSRGVCEVDDENNLVKIVERTKVYPDHGKIFYMDEDRPVEVGAETPVSMNFWGFDDTVFPFFEQEFVRFLATSGNDPKAEFFIPLAADNFIHSGKGTIEVIPTNAKWFGVTYKEDAPFVRESIQKLINEGIYGRSLW
ncbi:MAG: nucleotidyltransferase [Chitinophagaceae bacterium]|nr:nucleotidyltransferase [Chitinophagaceae bacterium]